MADIHGDESRAEKFDIAAPGIDQKKSMQAGDKPENDI
jgi:hypothetical protein